MTGHSHDDGPTCEEVMEQLFAYLDRELDEQMHDEIQRHLERCRDCFSRAEFERRLKTRLAETGTAAAPDRLRARVMTMIERF